MIKIYSFLAWFVINIWALTLRYVYAGSRRHKELPRGSVIYLFFHGEQFALYRGHRDRRGIVIMTSLSRDGELQDGILRRFGYDTARGSSSRGGARALVEMIRAVRSGCSSAFAADGPRGPARRIKPGPVYLAMKTGAFLAPIRVFFTRFRTLEKTWDQYRVPMPFSRVCVVYGDPVAPPSDASETAIEAACRDIERTMESLEPPPDFFRNSRGNIL